MGDRESKMGNGKREIGRFIEHKRKAEQAEKKEILSTGSHRAWMHF